MIPSTAVPRKIIVQELWRGKNKKLILLQVAPMFSKARTKTATVKIIDAVR